MNKMDAAELSVDKALCVGIDAGGTKVVIIDTASSGTYRYNSTDYPSMDAILNEYFAKVGQRPGSVVLAMAGPRDDETGNVRLTNADWPEFSPRAAEQRYPGTQFETANDMIGTAAGVLAETGVELETLKPGTPARTGTKLILAVSTGIGAAAAVWDARTKRYVFMASEGGHIGVQPENDDEAAYLRYLQTKYPHVSLEIALSGKAGIDHLIDHLLEKRAADGLKGAIDRARAGGRPVGAVLLEFAEANTGPDQLVAKTILHHLGNMLGSAIRDLAVAFKPTGGIYLTGSIALALGDYLARETQFLQRFVHPGATHDTWIEKIPISLVTDSHVAVKGALALAKQQSLLASN